MIDEILKPYEGIGKIKLYCKKNICIDYLKNNKIPFEIEIWDGEEDGSNDCWTIIKIKKCISLFFGNNDKLFKIYCTEGFKGSLPNGINLDTSIDNALKIDKTLHYDDDGEDYESNKGYWIEDNLKTKKLLSISIFIKEILNDDVFYKYNW